ncbi:hypothetical protein, variant [Cladophialophora immunda]|uniref:Uncharacterized protein n=1 Tax=Cladophialophora immunda TaxID=569365 RepID=A0A0D2CE91_9EURO|nr:uncharacterized protein PV07_12716 [Cladophialophora immunda]XP_016242086.1 hypothetical protein, variant [Cladophialophora immunda]KIW21869.1 hypothetical protein PV07_12716 [Cladophialophora immunda]KIW21870.1 hypothetical protein, variant [Cladophialophora immunda]
MPQHGEPPANDKIETQGTYRLWAKSAVVSYLDGRTENITNPQGYWIKVTEGMVVRYFEGYHSREDERPK